MTFLVSALAALLGVFIGAGLARRNTRREHADRLLADALNDVVTAIAEVASGNAAAQPRYAAAVSRIVLHGSPELVNTLQVFQQSATTATSQGRERFVDVVQAARKELGRRPLDTFDAQFLLFGGTEPHDELDTESRANDWH